MIFSNLTETVLLPVINWPEVDYRTQFFLIFIVFIHHKKIFYRTWSRHARLHASYQAYIYSLPFWRVWFFDLKWPWSSHMTLSKSRQINQLTSSAAYCIFVTFRALSHWLVNIQVSLSLNRMAIPFRSKYKINRK